MVSRRAADPVLAEERFEIGDALVGDVTVLSPYRFHAFELAGQLARQHALRRLITVMPRQTITEVPARYVSSRPRLAVPLHVFDRLHLPLRDAAHRVMVRDYDRWAARQVSDERVVVALSSFATSALNAASARGARTVCDRGSWHILEQKSVLDAEAERWGRPAVPFDPWLIDRELAEYESASMVTVPSEPARRSFIRRGVDPVRVTKLAYGVDVRKYSRSQSDARDYRRIISVAHVGLRKGQQYLVPAYRKVRRSGSSLVLVGDAPRANVASLDLPEDDVSLLGAVGRDRVAQELRRSGVFALASVEEGLALVIGQAMAAGLPVVATEATGAEELVTDGVEGFIVPTADVDRLAGALDALLSDEGLTRSMGEAAWGRMHDRGGWDQYGRDALAAYQRLAL